MKKSVLMLLGIAAISLFTGIHLINLQNTDLFPKPENLAQKIANFIEKNGEKSTFNDGNEEEGVSYTYKHYFGYEIYELVVGKYKTHKDEQKILEINHYVTNRPVGLLKSPSDLVAHELMYGRAEIHIEEHIYDRNIDMEVDLLQQNTKKRGPVYMGFTREEKDLGEKAGVQKYLYEDKHEYEKSGWKKASDETVAQIADEYGKHLFVISERLKIGKKMSLPEYLKLPY